MEDEIDIEEHDVLDNPVVKQVFPDITVLKKELTQYYEEEPIIKREPQDEETRPQQSSLPHNIQSNVTYIDNYQNQTSSKPLDKQSQLKQRNLIILGSRPKVIQECRKNHILGSNLNYRVTKSDTEKLLNNKEDVKNSQFRYMKLILQDIKSYLNQNGRYCKQCCRLFLSKNALDIHTNKVHPRTVGKEKYTIKINCKRILHECSICGSNFSSRYNLCRHVRSFHTENIQITTAKPKKQFYKCKICNICFKTHLSFKRHNSNEHKNINKSNDDEEYDKNNREGVFRTKNKDKGSSTTGNHETRFVKENRQIPNVSINIKPHIKSAKRESTVTFNKDKASTEKQNVEFIKENGRVLSTSEADVASNKKAFKPKHVTRVKNYNHDANNCCLHCNKVFSDQKSLIDHMYQILEPKKTSSDPINVDNVDGDIMKKDDEILFVCHQCSYYLPSIKAYLTHMVRNHKTEKFLNVKKEHFDAQCKYCSYRCSSIALHNKHIHSYHIDLMFKRIENEIENSQQIKNSESVFNEVSNFALESVLFECNKCSICFLSSDIAKDHKLHMVLLPDWKCPTCYRILKERDKVMHLKQHSFSESPKVLNLNETNCNVLYNCTKCAIHFTEKRYLEHYPKCESETTSSFYCSKCDILVDKFESIHHKTQHEQLGDVSDFSIIDSNIITTTDLMKKNNETECKLGPRKRLYKQHNYLTYCHTCNSFLTDFGLRHKNHINGTCSRITKYPCNECGLVFTNSVLAIHKERHKNDKKMKLQDCKFFDLQGKQIHPPIPEYPHCKICGIHFLRKNGISSHICGKTDFITCDICNIKLIEIAFNLHMSFHFYVMQRTSSFNETAQSPKISKTMKTKAKTHHASDTLKSTTKSEEKVYSQYTSSQYILYQCRNCAGVTEKSMLIKHNCDRNTLKKCLTCGLLITKYDFKTHLSKHTNLGNYYSENFKVILFGFNKSNKDVFKTLSPSFSGTVYDYSLYKCEICKICIKNYESTVKHSCLRNFDLDKKVCSKCDLNFRSSNLKLHIKQHETDPDFIKENINVIKFNRTNIARKHDNIQVKQNQTERDELATEKPINIDYDDAGMQTSFHGFNNNINVDYSKENNDMKNFDHTIENIIDADKEHSFEGCMKQSDDKVQPCNVYMAPNKNVGHGNEKKVHHANTMNPITNGKEISDFNVVDKGVAIDECNQNNVDNGKEETVDDDKVESIEAKTYNIIDENLRTLYKCIICELHFLSKLKTTEHLKKCQPKAKQYKQNCSKCHFLFNPSELFSHLVIHHKDKRKKQF